MTPIERRLQKAEGIVMPRPAQAITVLVEPNDNTAPEDLAEYATDLAAAKASGVRTVVVREGADRGHNRQEQDGIEYVPTLVHAGLIVASLMPSERGKASQLCDVMQAVSGTGFKPVKLPAG